LLDEIDKMSTDFRGDPSAALLEVLDPEQNNDLQRPLPGPRLRPLPGALHRHGEHHHTIPLPLQDRMEIIRWTGYTEPEKMAIAKRTWCPKQIEQNGMAGVDVNLTDSAVREIVDHYTQRGGRALARAPDLGGDPQAGGGVHQGRQEQEELQDRRPRGAAAAGRAASTATTAPTAPTRSAWRTASR
jgi:ATP-dependent Lon protease